MRLKTFLLPTVAVSLFGMSAAFLHLAVNKNEPIAKTKATADLTISNDSEFADFLANCNANLYAYSGQVVELTADVNAVVTSKPDNGFDGEFIGNGHTINVSINYDDTASGIFRNLFDNANFHDVNFTGSVTSRTYASPLCVYNNGLVENVSSSITINLSSYGYVGGILYRNNKTGTINNCKFTGSLTSHARAGGIACENEGIISNCLNEGTITTLTDNFAGGIVSVAGNSAFVNNTITSCVNKGTIHSANHDVGGIAGFAYSNSKITYCSNYGAVSSAGSATGRSDGGIVGRINGGAGSVAGASTCVNYCYNGGDVSSNFISGGIIGMINSGAAPVVSLVGNLSSGKLTNSATTNVGTFIGWANSNTISITDSWAIGELNASGANAKNGIGGGSAAGTGTSKINGVSNECREVIQKIREYDCKAITGFSTLYNDLASNEKTILGELNYYDDLNTYSMKTYAEAAEYIINDQAHGLHTGLIQINNNNMAIIIVTACIVVLSLTAVLLIIHRKKHEANI